MSVGTGNGTGIGVVLLLLPLILLMMFFLLCHLLFYRLIIINIANLITLLACALALA